MPPAAENLRPARRPMRQWLTAARWPEEEIEDVVLAVDEATSSVIEHAHATIPASPALHPTVDVPGVMEPAPDPGPSAAAAPGLLNGAARWRVRIEIVDHGRWRPSTADLQDQMRARGRGLPLMRALVDQVHIDTVLGGGTRVTLITTAGRSVGPVALSR